MFVFCDVFYSFSYILLCLSLHKVWRWNVSCQSLVPWKQPPAQVCTGITDINHTLSKCLKHLCSWSRGTSLAVHCAMWKASFGASFYSRYRMTLPIEEVFIVQPLQRFKAKAEMSEELAGGRREVIPPSMQLQWVHEKEQQSLVQ